MIEDLAGAIIAGGRGRRMGGANKALIEVEGSTIISRQLDVLRSITDHIAIVAVDSTPFADLGLPVVPDPIPDAGPVAGICAALSWSPVRKVLCVACDMPYLNAAVLRLIAERVTGDVDVAAPIIGSRPQPLSAVYSRDCAPAVRDRLARVKLRATHLLTEGDLKVSWIDESEIRTIDPTLRCFVNVNRPADLP